MMRYGVLIVDDDEAVVHSLMRVLHGADYDIASVTNGEEALAYIQSHKVDLMISDYKLSGMNGIDLLETVHKKHPGIVAILLTGQADVQIAADAVNRLSLYKFFVKPWDNNELQVAVKEAFRKHTASRPTEVTAADIMSKFPVTIKENTPLAAAAELMMRFKISGMPVLSLSGALTGIITATDLFRVMGEQEGKAPSGTASFAEDVNITEVMARRVETINKETTLREIIRLMFNKNIHTIPVVEGGELIGIVGRRDVLNAYYRSSRESKNR